jgi:hypothetical protein
MARICEAGEFRWRESSRERRKHRMIIENRDAPRPDSQFVRFPPTVPPCNTRYPPAVSQSCNPSI